MVLSALEVLAVLLSSDFAHEETNTAILTINSNQDKILFILFLHRKCCKIKITNLYVTSIGLFYKNQGRFWRVSDCEELSGGYSQEMIGLDY